MDENTSSASAAPQLVKTALSGLVGAFGSGNDSFQIVRRGFLRAQIEVLKGLTEAAENELAKTEKKPSVIEQIEIR